MLLPSQINEDPHQKRSNGHLPYYYRQTAIPSRDDVPPRNGSPVSNWETLQQCFQVHWRAKYIETSKKVLSSKYFNNVYLRRPHVFPVEGVVNTGCHSICLH